MFRTEELVKEFIKTHDIGIKEESLTGNTDGLEGWKDILYLHAVSQASFIDLLLTTNNETKMVLDDVVPIEESFNFNSSMMPYLYFPESGNRYINDINLYIYHVKHKLKEVEQIPFYNIQCPILPESRFYYSEKYMAIVEWNKKVLNLTKSKINNIALLGSLPLVISSIFALGVPVGLGIMMSLGGLYTCEDYIVDKYLKYKTDRLLKDREVKENKSILGFHSKNKNNIEQLLLKIDKGVFSVKDEQFKQKVDNIVQICNRINQAEKTNSYNEIDIYLKKLITLLDIAIEAENCNWDKGELKRKIYTLIDSLASIFSHMEKELLKSKKEDLLLRLKYLEGDINLYENYIKMKNLE